MVERNITINEAIFGQGANFNKRYITDYKKLKDVVTHCKGLGMKIVLTQGSYDMLHIGHARYFEEAKRHGDLLIIGVDSDEKIRSRKGPERPVVPQSERLEMVAHMRSVDIVVLKELKHPKWNLIKTIQPNTLISTKEMYTKKQIKDLKKYCGEVVVLEPQATTSTSAKIRKLQISTAKSLGQSLTPKIMNIIEEVLGDIKEVRGKMK
jgi:D-beta-D-heptose 7-phosphate kinase/D-beta-D-heptose 1-phosphate adenosyltransferase